MILTFLAAAGVAFMKNLLGDDDFNGTNFSSANAVGGLIARVTGAFTDDAAKAKITDAIKKNGIPVNHDIQRNIRKAFLSAAAQPARYLIRNYPLANKAERAALKYIIDYLEREAKKCNDLTYVPDTDNPANKAYGYLTNNAEDLDRQIPAAELLEQLNQSLLYELESVFYAKGDDPVPQIYKHTIANGWIEEGKAFSFFSFMCDYFHELIKSDNRLKNALQAEWLQQLLTGTEVLKGQIAGIYTKMEEAFEQLGGQSLAVQRKLDKILHKLTPQPKLVLFEGYDDQRHRTLFRNRYLQFFIGRDNEMLELMDFFNSESSFAWWVAVGPGGIGKSRLALEFCYELTYGFTELNVGFGINENSLYAFDWEKWEPTQPTLVVIDYASGHYKEVIGILETLSNREKEFYFPVRFLLLEREAKGTWWKEIENSIGYRIKKSPFKQPLQLSQLIAVDIWQIIEKVLLHYGKPIPAKEETLASLSKIDDQSRPLFAWFAAITLAEGETIRDWNVSQLLDSQLYREEKRVYKSLIGGESDTNRRMVAIHNNLTAIATITKGLSQEQVKQTLLTEYSWLPSVTDFSISVYNYISGVDDSNPRPYLPLEPDILGEYFVLKHVNTSNSNNPFALEDKLNGLKEIAWKNDTWQTMLFTLRMFNDFYSVPHKDFLISEPPLETTIEQKVMWAFLMVDIVRIYGQKKDLQQAEQLYRKIIQVAKKENSKELWKEVAKSSVNLINAYGRVDANFAVPHYKELKQLCEEQPIDEVYIDFARAAANMINHFGVSDRSYTLSYYEDLKQLVKEHPLTEVKIRLARAAANIVHKFESTEFEVATQYYKELKQFASENSINEVWTEVARATYNLVLFVGSEKPQLAIPYYNDLKQLTNEHSIQRVDVYYACAVTNLIRQTARIDKEVAITYYLELKAFADARLSNELLIEVSKALVNLTSGIGTIDANYAALYYNELKEFANKHSLIEIWINVARASVNIINAYGNTELTTAVTYYDELKHLANSHPYKEMWIEVSKAISNLTAYLSQSDISSPVPYYEELKQIAKEKSINEIWIWLSTTVVNLVNYFVVKDIDTAIKFYEEVKRIATEHPLDKIFISVATAAFNLSLRLGVSEMVHAIRYYNELKGLSKEHPVKEVLIYTAQATYNLATVFCNQDTSQAVPYFEGLKQLAKDYPLPDIQTEVAKIARNITVSFYHTRQDDECVKFFRDKFLPIAQLYNIPTVWLQVAMSFGMFLTKFEMSEHEYNYYRSFYIQLFNQYHKDSSWQQEVQWLYNLYQDLNK